MLRSSGVNQQQQQQPQQQGGLFSSVNKPAQPSGGRFGSSLGGGLTMGQSQNQSNQQSVPGVRIDISQVRGTTRFNDLHEDLQKEIEFLDKVILSQQARSGDINAILPSHAEQLSFIPDNADFLSRKLLGVETALESDAEAVARLQAYVKTDATHAKLSFKVIDNQRQPKDYHQNGTGQDIVSFFSQAADDMAATLSNYQSRISEIESHLRGVEASTIQQAQALTGSSLGGGAADDQMRELTAVLREFEQGILSVAGEVGAARENVQQLQMGGYLEIGQADGGRGSVNGGAKRSGIY
jgi:nucleoporin p58/p45